LESVLVSAEMPPVVIRKDTIEFNVAAFKTFPDALVEDLLKKLPGVEVDHNGNITFQGRRVTQIKVDGTDFFGSNPKVASRNLPANIIEKAQVTDDYDDKMTHPNAPEWEIGKVINLKLKKEIKGGIFGKIYAGEGTDDRYEMGGILNTFRDTLQASVIGYANNLSQPAAFSAEDMRSLAGFQRSGFNNMNIDQGGSVASIDNTNFGGNGTGIQSSNGIGTNINEQFGPRTTANLQYFYSHTDNQIDQLTDTRQWYSETVLHTQSGISQNQAANTSQFTGKLTERLSSVAKLTFTPLLSISSNPVGSQSATASSTQYNPSLNSSNDNNRISDHHIFYRHELLFRDFKLKKAGRTLTVANTLFVENQKTDQYTYAQSAYYNADTSVLDQLRETKKPNIKGAISASYVEPLGRNTDFSFVTTVDYFRNQANIGTFNPDSSTGKYQIPIDSLSSKLVQNGIKSMTRLAVEQQIGKSFLLSPGILWQSIDIDNNTEPGHIHQDYRWILPYLSLTWKRMLRFSYTSQLTEPPVYDLITTVNNTNPLSRTIGDPSLKPTLSHLFNLSFNRYIANHSEQLSASIYATINENAIAAATSVSDNGVQITTPFNTSQSWTVGSSLGFRQQYKFSGNRQLSFHVSAIGNWTRDIVRINSIESPQDIININPQVIASFNWKDIFILDERYNISFNTSSYGNIVFQNIHYTIQRMSTYLHVVPSASFFLEASLVYQYNPENGLALRKTNVLWNGSINYKFVKNRQATLKLSFFDLLNQNNGLQTLVSQNYIESIQTKNLGHYYMLTFLYDVRKFGKAKPYRGIFNF
jgi:hypothetical protein